MYPGVIGKLRMECRRHDFPFADDHGIVPLRCKHFNLRTETADFWCTNENHFDREPAKNSGTNGTIDLAAVSIAPDGNIDCAQSYLRWIFHVLGEQDRARAGAEGWLLAHERFEFFEPRFTEKLEEGARLSSGNYEAVNFIELLRLFDQHNFSAQLFEPASVGVEIALQGQDTDENSRWFVVVGR